MCACGDASYHGEYKCFRCGERIVSIGRVPIEKVYELVVMPQQTHDTFTLPWPNLLMSIALSFGFYRSNDRLIMPVMDYEIDKPVFYSARLLDGEGLKYLYPSKAKKVYWTSSKELIRPVTFICEGIADAAYMSQWGNSVALMGVNYNRSLDVLLKDKKVIILFDGDTRGILGSCKVEYQLQPVARVVGLTLPDGKDPVDLTPKEMEEFLAKEDKIDGLCSLSMGEG